MEDIKIRKVKSRYDKVLATEEYNQITTLRAKAFLIIINR